MKAGNDTKTRSDKCIECNLRVKGGGDEDGKGKMVFVRPSGEDE